MAGFTSAAKTQPYTAGGSMGLEETALVKKKALPLGQKKKGSAMATGERVARIRKERGVTQIEMAKRLGLTQARVSHYECGRIRLHADMVAEIARILDVSADELLGLKPPKASALVSAEERRLWKHFRRVAQLPERDQRAVLRLIASAAAGRDPRAD